MKTENVSKLLLPLLGVAVVSGLMGYVVGYSVGGGLTPPAKADISDLTSAVVQRIDASGMGTVYAVDGDVIVLEKNGERLAVEHNPEYVEILLTTTDLLTEEDERIWDQYQADLIKYAQDMESFMSDPEALPGSENEPVAPFVPFSIIEEAVTPEGDMEPQSRKFKTNTQRITPEQLVKGDQVIVNLSSDAGAFGEDLSSEKLLYLTSMRVQRGEKTN